MIKKDFIVRRTIIELEGKPHVETYSEQELIRCKDCKFAKEELCEIAYRFGEKEDWFCADGTRRDDNAR